MSCLRPDTERGIALGLITADVALRAAIGWEEAKIDRNRRGMDPRGAADCLIEATYWLGVAIHLDAHRP